MKKSALILLLVAYSLSTFGVGLKEFYCCGKLESVTVELSAEVEKAECDEGDNKPGCCKTKFQFFKVKDKHFASGDVTFPVKYFLDVLYLTSFYKIIPLIPQQINIINGSHAPPLFKGVPVYIANCVFRV